MKKVLLVTFISVYSFLGAQIDFSNYTPLQAQGELPQIVATPVEQRIADDLTKSRTSLTKKEKEKFVENNQYGLNSLIYSGDMLFGDPLTKYVNQVAKILLDANPSLNQNYQFFVLRSNVTNALCTDPSVIFVTTGLLSQIENEAQLATVLAHEMIHKEEEHFEESFSTESQARQSSESRDKYIVAMSSHSKDLEFEADRLAIEICKKAGYGKSGLLSAFDVLMYSYLPFDEIRLEEEYYQNDKIHIPTSYFPKKVNDILAEDDYDDSKSTHPNIKKRREAVWKEVEVLSGWTNTDFKLSQDKFIEVRTIARFESVRNDLITGKYGDALYSIYLLEKKYPNNKYLSFSKAQAWNGLVNAKISGGYFNAIRKPKKVEGESHAMHYMLRKLKKEQLFSVALRMVQDELNKFPSEKKIKEVRKELLTNLAEESKFDLSDYDTINFQSAVQRFEESKEQLSDTVQAESTAEKTTTGSKYDRIKNKRKSISANHQDEDFDSTKFHLYALFDLRNDKEIKQILLDKKRSIEELKKKKEAFGALSRKQQKKQVEKVDGLIVFQPKFIMKSAKGKKKYSQVYFRSVDEAVDLAGSKMELNFSKIKMTTDDLAGFNEVAIIENYLFQVFKTENPFPVDYDGVELFRSKYQGDYGVLFVAEYIERRRSKKTYISGFLINMVTGETEKRIAHSYRGKPKKMLIKGYVYDIISHFGQKQL